MSVVFWEKNNIDLQIEYLIGELTPGGGCNGYAKYQFSGFEDQRNTWMNASDPRDAAIAFCQGFERPNEALARNGVRSEAAEKYYKKYGQRTTTTSSTTQ